MEPIVTAEEMKYYDRFTIERIGIPALVLMERAALAVAEEVKAHSKGGNVLILAGTGNNGGDGLAVARLLAESGYDVEVSLCGEPEKATEEWKAQERILRNFPVRTGRKPSGKEYTVLVDALFGVGLSRPVTGEFAEAVAFFNTCKGYKIAVDVPSGIHSDTGAVCGCAVKADMTVCLGLPKRGVLLYPGSACSGAVKVKEIGIAKAALLERRPGMFRYTEEIGDLLPPRPEDGNKGTFGKVVLIAGSRNMAGAAVLAAKSCYRSGAGMVKVVTPECNRLILQTAVPEALLCTCREEADGKCEGLEAESLGRDEAAVKAALGWADVLAVGPGLGTGTLAKALLRAALEEGGKPLVLDADALNLLAGSPELRALLETQALYGRQVILTPHVGELSRLTGEPVAEIKAHPAESVGALANRLHCVVAGKDARTLICMGAKEGEEKCPVCLNTSGNSGMATAGSGDVLTGVVAGLLAQGMPPFQAVAVGVYWHAAAGDRAAGRLGTYGVTAEDMISFL